MRSVLLALHRVRAFGDENERAPREAAERLLYALALLPSRAAPASLFCDDDVHHVVVPLLEGSHSAEEEQALSVVLVSPVTCYVHS